MYKYNEQITQKREDKDSQTSIVNKTVLTSAKKISTAYFVMLIVSMVSSFVCLLCNYMINHIFSWSLYPVGSWIVLWSAIIPLIKLKKYRIWGSMLGFSISSIPYLFLIQYLSASEGWVIPLALPILFLSVAILGISLFLFIHTRLNKWYDSAITVFLFGVVFNISIDKIIEGFLNKPGANEISMISSSLTSIFIAMALLVIGYIRKNKNRTYCCLG
jgi:hypothetical protein